MDLGATPIIVTDPSDTNYDFVFYEYLNTTDNKVYMDCIILSISSDGITYYEVFNWCDDFSDDNSNVSYSILSLGIPPHPSDESDNQDISYVSLYGIPPAPKAGILIDVDNNLPGVPAPRGSYRFLAIQAVFAVGGDGVAEIDSIEVIDVAP